VFVVSSKLAQIVSFNGSTLQDLLKFTLNVPPNCLSLGSLPLMFRVCITIVGKLTLDGLNEEITLVGRAESQENQVYLFFCQKYCDI
jgi:hypothetical protein